MFRRRLYDRAAILTEKMIDTPGISIGAKYRRSNPIMHYDVLFIQKR